MAGTTVPTSALTFQDLILETARMLGVCSYGTDGTGAAAIPTDDHDLAECKRHVNNAIRMFYTDQPPAGWYWTHQIIELTLWPTVAVSATRTITGGSYDPVNDQTLVTVNSANTFVESMEEHNIDVTGLGAWQVKQYVSDTQVYVYGNHFLTTPTTYSMTPDGNYTMPRDFAGSFDSAITFKAATNRAIMIEWGNEGDIRRLRENVTIVKGYPRLLAIRPKSLPEKLRRFEAMSYPIPDNTFVVQFQYDSAFDKLVNLTDVPPCPINHDEAIKAACMAVVERDTDKVVDGPYMKHYQAMLEKSWLFDSRLAPKKLGYFGNPRVNVNARNFREFMKRPTVTFGP